MKLLKKVVHNCSTDKMNIAQNFQKNALVSAKTCNRSKFRTHSNNSDGDFREDS